MTATYTAIGRELWGQQAIGEATEVQKESIKSKRRVNSIPSSLQVAIFIWGLVVNPNKLYLYSFSDFFRC